MSAYAVRYAGIYPYHPPSPPARKGVAAGRLWLGLRVADDQSIGLILPAETPIGEMMARVAAWEREK